MLELDHLTVIAPSLRQGVDHVQACLGIETPFGRTHPYMATHNHVLRLGDAVYLEIVAADPSMPRPPYPRWFGLDDFEAVAADWDRGFRLRGWVARVSDIDAVLPLHEAILGRKTTLGPTEAPFFFSIPANGSLPSDGLAPSVIDRRGRPPPIAAMARLGTELRSLSVEHPDLEQVEALYDRLAIKDPPRIEAGTTFRYRAVIATPGGDRTLS